MTNETKAYNLFRNLKEAWASSSRRFNNFAELVHLTNWDTKFSADGEMYFCKDGLMLCLVSLDPFERVAEVPTVMIGVDYFDIRGNRLAA